MKQDLKALKKAGTFLIFSVIETCRMFHMMIKV